MRVHLLKGELGTEGCEWHYPAHPYSRIPKSIVTLTLKFEDEAAPQCTANIAMEKANSQLSQYL